MLRWLLLLLCSAGAWAQEPGQPLRVVTDYWPPFRMAGADGQLEGLDIDLLRELEKRTGLRFEIRLQPWARALEDMRSGQADLMTGLARTPEREQYIDYLEPSYYGCAPRFYGAPQRAESLVSYQQLQGLRIGYVLQSVYFEPFDSDTSLLKVGVKNEDQLLKMLLRGRVELLIGTDCQVDYQLRDAQLAQRLVKLAYQPPASTSLYLGLSRAAGHSDERDLLIDTLQQLLREGWLQHAAEAYH
ncbi:transporter substrate-binding domain-containing protein [Pseudomonas sp. GOM6]|uniref:substrate-binding periplasmic protein n=1 Tax=Pseudomonas sp. GOM6 TaxID=3036944 RepID=UPI002409F872|nr:transporter substrate-binding domain-containing protein [Pseudomonas sp. GOM6]MDG1580662.1 transporter substrate-binding domain-containing protein [Pseudomonas sp. GOM6]